MPEGQRRSRARKHWVPNVIEEVLKEEIPENTKLRVKTRAKIHNLLEEVAKHTGKTPEEIATEIIENAREIAKREGVPVHRAVREVLRGQLRGVLKVKLGPKPGPARKYGVPNVIEKEVLSRISNPHYRVQIRKKIYDLITDIPYEEMDRVAEEAVEAAKRVAEEHDVSLREALEYVLRKMAGEPVEPYDMPTVQRRNRSQNVPEMERMLQSSTNRPILKTLAHLPPERFREILNKVAALEEKGFSLRSAWSFVVKNAVGVNSSEIIRIVVLKHLDEILERAEKGESPTEVAREIAARLVGIPYNRTYITGKDTERMREE